MDNQRYAVWIGITGMGNLPDQIIIDAPDADTAILRVGMTIGKDFGDQVNCAFVVEVRDETGRKV